MEQFSRKAHVGVRWLQKHAKWEARIYLTRGKAVYLGRYARQEDALAAYEFAANEKRMKVNVTRRLAGHQRPKKVRVERPKSPRRRDNSTGFTGVTLQPRKYVAQIRVDGCLTRLGAFDTPEEASEAYQAAKAKVTRGEEL